MLETAFAKCFPRYSESLCAVSAVEAAKIPGSTVPQQALQKPAQAWPAVKWLELVLLSINVFAIRHARARN